MSQKKGPRTQNTPGQHTWRKRHGQARKSNRNVQSHHGPTPGINRESSAPLMRRPNHQRCERGSRAGTGSGTNGGGGAVQRRRDRAPIAAGEAGTSKVSLNPATEVPGTTRPTAYAPTPRTGTYNLPIVSRNLIGPHRRRHRPVLRMDRKFLFPDTATIGCRGSPPFSAAAGADQALHVLP